MVDSVTRFLLLTLGQDSSEGLIDVVLADTIDRSVVDEQPDESLQVNFEVGLTARSICAETHLVHHIFNFLLRRVVAHGSHQVSQLVYWHPAFELARLGRVLLLRADHRVIEEVVYVLVCLSRGATFDKLDKGLDTFTAHSDSLFNRRDINMPHVDREVRTTACEDKLAVSAGTDVLDFVRVCDETHSLVRVAVERQLDQTDDLLVRGVKKVLLSIAAMVV